MNIVFAIVALVVIAALAFVAIANERIISSTERLIHEADDFGRATAEQTGQGADAVAFSPDNPADAVIVLGAMVRADGTPSGILADRLDAGIAVYRMGAARTIMVSGNGTREHNKEAQAMAAYCVSKGVPERDVVQDPAGFTTYDTMENASSEFGFKRVIVTTQTYHLYRAIYTAQGMGMQAQGVSANYRAYRNQSWYDIREVISRTKAYLQVGTARFEPSAARLSD